MCKPNRPKADYHILDALVLEELSPFQRILLSADGTLTKLLEIALGERMFIIKLFEAVFPIPYSIEALELEKGQTVIERKILLQGKLSGRNWLYADSIIVFDRLEKTFQDKLLNSNIPIGKLWIEHKTETYKEIFAARREPANHLGEYFKITIQDMLLSRTYRVFCCHLPVMMITEKFPECYFQGNLIATQSSS